MILDRDAMKWFRPPRGQFAIFYRAGGTELAYQPDFVAETTDGILMLECKDAKAMADADVLAKRNAAVLWCRRATDHAVAHGGKPWTYLLIPRDVIAENSALDGLIGRYAVTDHLRGTGMPTR